MSMQPEDLVLLVTRSMPFGKYKGRLIADLPGNYLNWFAREGFPPGEIGRLLALMQEIDHNGLSELLEPLLPEDWTTVGISLQVQHKAPTPVGAVVRAEAEVIAVDGRKVTFSVRAFDDREEIGSGQHERFAVQSEKFLAKAMAKR